MSDSKITTRRLPGATDQSGDEAAFEISDRKPKRECCTLCMTTTAGFSRPLPQTLFGPPVAYQCLIWTVPSWAWHVMAALLRHSRTMARISHEQIDAVHSFASIVFAERTDGSPIPIP